VCADAIARREPLATDEPEPAGDGRVAPRDAPSSGPVMQPSSDIDM
jgi:hypothetical protein